MKVDQARHVKELEQENARLKRAVANLTLDKLILEEAAKGNFCAPSEDAGRWCMYASGSGRVSGMRAGCWASHGRRSIVGGRCGPTRRRFARTWCG